MNNENKTGTIKDDTRRINSMLSLCKRAGQLVSGESKCESAIKAKRARLVILSLYASKNTAKKFVNSSLYYKVPLYVLNLSKEELGGIIGESERAIITIIGDDFVKELKVCLSKFEYNGGGPIV